MDTSEVKNPNRKLAVHQFQQAEYQRQEWVVTPERGTSIEEMKNPLYWSNVARALRPADKIIVRFFDFEEYAELLVRTVEPYAASVVVINHLKFGSNAADAIGADLKAPEGYEVKFRGRAGWCVLRLTDNQIVHEGERNRANAVMWAEQYVRKLAA